MNEKPRPILTVMSDFGGAFLWHNRDGTPDHGIGGNCCAHDWRCSSHPISLDLFKELEAWYEIFASAPIPRPFEGKLALDWEAFHVRGLALARRLKEEVGQDFRVRYDKPYEDPDTETDERREILDDGAIVPWPNHHG